MSPRTMWFLAGLVILALLATHAPRIAGGVVILLVGFLAIELANKKLV